MMQVQYRSYRPGADCRICKGAYKLNHVLKNSRPLCKDFFPDLHRLAERFKESGFHAWKSFH